MAAQLRRQRADGAQIPRDVVAFHAIAPRRTEHEFSMLEPQAHSHAVDLRLHEPADRLARQRLLDAGDVFPQRLGSVGGEEIVEAQHLDGVPHAAEALARLAAHALRRRIRGDQLRVRGLE